MHWGSPETGTILAGCRQGGIVHHILRQLLSLSLLIFALAAGLLNGGVFFRFFFQFKKSLLGWITHRLRSTRNINDFKVEIHI